MSDKRELVFICINVWYVTEKREGGNNGKMKSSVSSDNNQSVSTFGYLFSI